MTVASLALGSIVAACQHTPPLDGVSGASGSFAERTPIPAQTIFSRFQADCEADDGRLWGISLCGPLLLIENDGRITANTQDARGRLRKSGGLWVAMPDEKGSPPRSNTATEWSGTRWAIITRSSDWSLDDYARLALHESFHRIQPQLPFARSNNATADHLDEEAGRLWLRLSLRALAAALRAPDSTTARRHLAASLAMSSYRHGLFPDAEAVERRIEFHEGVAEYTGWRLARTDAVERAFADMLDKGDATQSFARSHAYLAGPAWGLAFDRLGIDWRRMLTADGPGFVTLGSRALRLEGVISSESAAVAAAPYGHARLVTEERERAVQLAVRRDRFMARFVNGPRLIVPLVSINFNPQTVTTLGEHGQVYGTLSSEGPWGSLRTEHGALVHWPSRRITVDALGDARQPIWATPSWRFELNPGWHLEQRGVDLIVVEANTDGKG